MTRCATGPPGPASLVRPVIGLMALLLAGCGEPDPFGTNARQMKELARELAPLEKELEALVADYVEVEVVGFAADRAEGDTTGGAYVLVLGEVGGRRHLAFSIGAFEALAIALELEGEHPPRPLTHDLLRDAFSALEADVVAVIIDDVVDGTYFASVRFFHGGAMGALDARPSDAVALALRAGTPIWADEALLEEGAPPEAAASPEAPPSRARM